MPLLRTTEKIFIGYSAPQLGQKEAAERIIAGINAANRHKQIQLYVCEYRRMLVDTVRIQEGIDRQIESCDLVILLFGGDVGSGLAWETRFTLDLFRTGRIYKLLPYIFTREATTQTARGDNNLDVQRFYDLNGVLYYKVDRTSAFEDLLRNHLEVWLTEEERIVERQRDFLRRGLLRHFAIDDIVFGDEIQAFEKAKGRSGSSPETEKAFREYVGATDYMVREDAMQYYLIARHLLDAVLRDRRDVFEKVEFINAIHQYLAALLRRADQEVRDCVVQNYQEWVESRQLSERTRGFAAFQLGMMEARVSADLLLTTARNHGEIRSIRHYAIYALGMLRQRSKIVPLMDLHAEESDDILRDALTNSILFMTGVTE